MCLCCGTWSVLLYYRTEDAEVCEITLRSKTHRPLLRVVRCGTSVKSSDYYPLLSHRPRPLPLPLSASPKCLFAAPCAVNAPFGDHGGASTGFAARTLEVWICLFERNTLHAMVSDSANFVSCAPFRVDAATPPRRICNFHRGLDIRRSPLRSAGMLLMKMYCGT